MSAVHTAEAAAGINQQINFQGRLFNAQGATVADGYYNIQFKIYQDGDGDTAGNPGGTLEWTENHLNSASDGVQVKNGFLSVQLGSVTPFGTSVDWNQDTLWLSMHVGDTSSCTISTNFEDDCNGDGEMVPMKRLSAVPYAMNSQLLGGLTSANFLQLAQGTQTDASTGMNSIAINKTGTGNLLVLQSSGADVFTLSGTGDALFGANANHSLSVETAGSGVAGRNLTLTAGTAGTGGSALIGGTLVLQGGAGGGTNGNGGDVTINAGNAQGSGTDGVINIGASNTSAVVIGVATTIDATLEVDSGTPGTSGVKLTQLTSASTPTGAYSGMLGVDDEGNIGLSATPSILASQALAYWDGNNDPSTGGNAYPLAALTYDAAYDAGNGVRLTANSANQHGALNWSFSQQQFERIQFKFRAGGTAGGADATWFYAYADGVPTTEYGGTVDFTQGYIVYFSEYHNCIGIAYGPYWDGQQCNGDGTANHPLVDATKTDIDDNNWHDVDISILYNQIIVRWDGVVVLSYSDVYTRDTSAYNFGFGARTGAVTNAHYIKGLVVSKLGTNVAEYNIANVTAMQNALYWDNINGRLGIGTEAPQAVFDSRGSAYVGSAGSGDAAAGTLINIQGGTTANTAVTIGTNGAGGITIDSGTTGSILIGNGANAKTVTIGNTTTTTALNLQGGVSGAVNIGSVGSSTLSSTTHIADTNNATGTQLVTIGSASNTNNAVTIEAGNTGTIQIGNGATAHTIAVGTGAAAQAVTVGSTNTTSTLTLQGGTTANTAIQIVTNTTGGITIDSGTTGAVTIGGGANAKTVTVGNTTTTTALYLQGGTTGSVNVGTSGATTVQIGNTTLNAGTQAINIGNNNTAGGTTNVTIGAGSSATGGTTAIQSKGNTTVTTNGVARATFDTSSFLYLGNGVSAPAPTNFTISGTSSSANGVAGGSLAVQGGNATSGNANGGNLTLTGGTGVGSGSQGLVVLSSTTIATMVTDPNCYTGGALVATSCTIAQASVDGYSSVVVGFSQGAQTATLPSPSMTAAGRMIYITAANGSSDFTLSVNGGGTGNLIAMRQNTSATMIWNGAGWTAAGASSSTTLQAAYDNTLTSAGGAELVLNTPGGSADGLTIRNNATTPIVGGILEVQTSIGSNLLSVNNNASEYATNGGAETSGASSSTFPSNTWDNTTGGTVDRWTTAGDNIATGQASVRVQASGTNHGARNRLASSLTPGLTYIVSFAVRGASNFSTLQVLYSPDGTTSGTTQCATAQVATSGTWTRITCSFTAGGTITTSNSILIRQTDGTTRTFYIDNLSVNVNASATFAADGSVDAALGTNWTAFGTLDNLTRDTTVIYDTSGSVNVDTPNNTDRGVRNNLAITPAINTQYLVTFYARSTNTFNDIRVRYSRDGGTNFVSCVDYSTQTVSTTAFTEITCLFTTDGTAATNADLIIDQPSASDRNFYVDALSITLNTNNSSNVQIGGANKGGPVTLFTLDRSNGAPIAANNEAYLGSMYYDTATGRIQCYEADGWGACGAAPDNIVNLNPEYPGAVLNGSGIGTMTADFCSNDAALSVNSALCSTGQAKNYYQWTSPQATQQTYSVIVSYQLPATFKSFASDDIVQLVARTDSTSNAAVTYQMFKSDGSTVTQCGSGETTVVTTADTWQSVGINGNEATGCSFNTSSAGNFVIFKINLKANTNANAYVSTLSFTTTGR